MSVFRHSMEASAIRFVLFAIHTEFQELKRRDLDLIKNNFAIKATLTFVCLFAQELK